ncbi:hypothetical protein [Trinickia dinghuensis]|uniref:hypothetical protein n=1 Tax=Trinickia dinghuensis TaxID=2291023 RepID=UPI0015F16AEB|nr:hypothetical protein [Trinickia dinghuensis]
MTVEPDALEDSISAVLASVGGRLSAHVTLNDDIVRYFMVTPPANGLRMQDLRGAADMRFQTLYGESVAPWQLVADWQADGSFLACAVPRRVLDALRAAATAQRASLVSVTPAFVVAWNGMRRDLSANAWLATLNGGVLTLGVIAGSAPFKLAAVRTLVLRGDDWSTASLREEVERTALLEDVPLPTLLHVRGPSSAALQSESARPVEGIDVRWHSADVDGPAGPSDGSAVPADFVQSGAMT